MISGRVPARSSGVSDFDAVVVGAGPAGLSAVHALRGSGLSVLLVEEGRPSGERDRNSCKDVPSGIGGAGLFSDGKFSFYPSATKLWALPGAEQLRTAYAATCARLGRYGMATPPFPSAVERQSGDAAGWTLKNYHSEYLSFDDRLRLIADMTGEAECGILTASRVICVDRPADSPHSLFRVVIEQPGGRKSAITCRTLILATGRFGPLGPVSGFYLSIFRRLEVGVRLQQPMHHSFFRHLPSADPKLKLNGRGDRAEWRTFCACRGGETVVTKTSGYWSVSGRADGPSTGYSNIGFNVRLLDPDLAGRALPSLLRQLRCREVIFKMPLAELTSRKGSAGTPIEASLGPRLTSLIQHGLTQLMDTYPEVAADATIIGPTIEGIGSYPAIGPDLQLPGIPCWVVGDATGIFRGIIAAMVSGYYAGLAVHDGLDS